MLDHLVAKSGTIALLGGIDTGKTSFGLSLAAAAKEKGLKTAYVDADVGQSTVGPPACIGLKFLEGLDHVDRESVADADELAFVGSTSPSGHLLPLVSGTGRLVRDAKEAGADLIIVDTSGLISGVYAEILKYHKLQLIRPDAVVGFQRGSELDPILGVLSRFLPVDVMALKVHDAVEERSIEDRVSHREERFRAYFGAPLQRWRMKTTVFMPSLQLEADLSRFDGLLVGLENGKGRCLGIGLLEFDPEEQLLRMISPVAEGATGLVLGSMRMTVEGKLLNMVTPRELFGSE